ncbi:hydroxyproline-rich glycoprotein family protein [Parasponia andersonii]|uniref:Hydroxyproline-rich glycoprotein family protein n=1 Tax=Parasponia andersonii TaxID=3476 RepID=A0A2P5CF34_PARAD|nr:hydroxyproline-rich glycoprotein family protein [Parasponia andersonii]
MEEDKAIPSSSLSSSTSSGTRPSISFPLGIAFLVIMLLCITAFFLCCLYWDRLRSLQLSNSDPQHDAADTSQTDFAHSPPQKPLRPPPMAKQKDQAQSTVPVLMPGDEVPKFIAIARPCEPPVMLVEKITVVVHKPPQYSRAYNTSTTTTTPSL